YDEAKITKALQDRGIPWERKDKTLFYCNTDGSVSVGFLYRTCSSECHDSGAGKDDVCVW
ncbi:hypothetical protein E4U33_000998, partial [Claviceps sp. LM78 group G4]